MGSKIILALCFLLMIRSLVVQGQSDDSTTMSVLKTDDFQLTGDGKAPQWKKMAWLSLPKRNHGGVQYETDFKILYSDSGLYCLYRCQDNKITATLKEDFSDLFNEDVVEAFFWTDQSVPLYFEYELSPLNYELAILVPNFKGDFLGWRPWHYEAGRKTRHATHISEAGGKVLFWTAEFFIPFSLLKPMQAVPARSGMRWRANFYRIDYDEHISEWSWRQTRTNFHDYERFGTLVFE
jgi:hypothetical protein